MRFANAETRERHKFLETAQQETIDSLQLDCVAERMGEDFVRNTVFLAGLLEIPNIKNGMIKSSKKFDDTGKVPYVALRSGEKLDVDPEFNTMDSVQKKKVMDKLSGWTNGVVAPGPLLRDVDKSLKETSAINLSIDGFDGIVSGAVTVFDINQRFAERLGKSHTRVFYGQPIVGLAFDSGLKFPSTTLVHELRHVRQRKIDPVGPVDPEKRYQKKLRRELEAYHDGGHYGAALYFSDHPRYAGQTELLGQFGIESLRQDNKNPADPFYPTPALRTAIEAEGIDIVA